MLAKPSECLLYRKSVEGGLGLHPVGCRARAALTKTFIEPALGANFKVNPFHKLLIDHYVLSDGSPSPGNPTYFGKAFYNNIKLAIEGGEKVENLTMKDWYEGYLKQEITHSIDVESGQKTLRMSRTDYIYSQIKHEISWSV